MRIKTLVLALAMVAATGPAMANCYEGIGCDDGDYFSRGDLRQLSCQALWEVRNAIYDQNGFCFQTDRAARFFGNAGCSVNNQSQVRLNVYERSNVEAIRSVERSKGCG